MCFRLVTRLVTQQKTMDMVSLYSHNVSNKVFHDLFGRERKKCGLEMVVTEHRKLKYADLSHCDLRSDL